jgi:hypothetical protein
MRERTKKKRGTLMLRKCRSQNRNFRPTKIPYSDVIKFNHRISRFTREYSFSSPECHFFSSHQAAGGYLLSLLLLATSSSTSIASTCSRHNTLSESIHNKQVKDLRKTTSVERMINMIRECGRTTSFPI